MGNPSSEDLSVNAKRPSRDLHSSAFSSRDTSGPLRTTFLSLETIPEPVSTMSSSQQSFIFRSARRALSCGKSYIEAFALRDRYESEANPLFRAWPCGSARFEISKLNNGLESRSWYTFEAWVNVDRDLVKDK